LSIDGFKELVEPRESISTWLRRSEDAELPTQTNGTFQPLDVTAPSTAFLEKLFSQSSYSSYSPVILLDLDDKLGINRQACDLIVPVSEVCTVTGSGAVFVQAKRAQRKDKKSGNLKVKFMATGINKRRVPRTLRDLRRAAFGTRKITEYFNCND